MKPTCKTCAFWVHARAIPDGQRPTRLESGASAADYGRCNADDTKGRGQPMFVAYDHWDDVHGALFTVEGFGCVLHVPFDQPREFEATIAELAADLGCAPQPLAVLKAARDRVKATLDEVKARQETVEQEVERRVKEAGDEWRNRGRVPPKPPAQDPVCGNGELDAGQTSDKDRRGWKP